MSKLYFTGIGSRETPEDIQKTLRAICKTLVNHGFILRSGGAEGADTAAEQGCDLAKGEKEIYLPWKNFNDNPSPLYTIPQEAYDIAFKFHPRFSALQGASQKLMARNGMQVLGSDLKTPSKFIVCWTPNGAEVGGTSQAIRIAKAHGIPVYNLFHEESSELLKNKVREILSNN